MGSDGLSSSPYDLTSHPQGEELSPPPTQSSARKQQASLTKLHFAALGWLDSPLPPEVRKLFHPLVA
jgi:hypothetical protein